MLQELLDLLFPRRSLSGESGEWITEEERKQLASFPVIESKEQLLKRGLKYIDKITAGSTYQNCPLLKKAIHTFKYRRIKPIASDLAGLMLHAKPDLAGAVLCPVPLHWTRKFSRGFNQSESMAEIVGKITDTPVVELLKRTRPTGHQVKLKRPDRFTNVLNAFACITQNPPPKVILIDDLSTTGATLDECAKALKIAGVSRVEGWVVAHG